MVSASREEGKTGRTFKYTLDYIGACKPTSALIENVSGLAQKPKDDPSSISDADYVCNEVQRMGYTGSWHLNKATVCAEAAQVLPNPIVLVPRNGPSISLSG